MKLRAVYVCVNQRTWSAMRLNPADVFKVTQPRLRGAPAIPLTLYNDKCAVVRWNHRTAARLTLADYAHSVGI